MAIFSKSLAALTPVIALAIGATGGGAAGASGGPEPARALALNVVESEGLVEVQLIANSQVTQQVEYHVELVGNSRSRHNGNTSIQGGSTHVLSTLRTNYDENWCATVEVTEASGASYTLTAGDC